MWANNIIRTIKKNQTYIWTSTRCFDRTTLLIRKKPVTSKESHPDDKKTNIGWKSLCFFLWETLRFGSGQIVKRVGISYTSIIYCIRILDSIAASLFVLNWLSWQLSVSDDKIQITILILRRSALSNEYTYIKWGDVFVCPSISLLHLLFPRSSAGILWILCFG